MKKVLLIGLAVVVAVGIAVPVAMAAPAPKTTGGIGYTAHDLERHLSFNAIQSKTDTCSTLWNVEGVTTFDFQLNNDPTPGTHYVHDAALTQNGLDVTGSGGYPVAGPYAYAWDVTTGSVAGNTLDLTMVYDVGVPGVTHTMTGTIAPTGVITGTWQDNAGLSGATRTGTFTASGATAIATYCGKGHVSYKDANGNWYFVNVKAVNVDGDDAWLAGPVIASNLGYTAPLNWLFLKVSDLGDPGKDVDQAVGVITDEITAINGVTGKVQPAETVITITSGNLQVH